MKKKRRTKKKINSNIIIGAVVLIWLMFTALSIIFSVIAKINGEVGPNTSAIIIGQFFFVLGLLPIVLDRKSRFREKLLPLIFCVVGAIFLVVGMANSMGELDMEVFLSTYFPRIFAIATIIVGVGLILGPRLINKIDSKRCTLGIMATCKGYEREKLERNRYAYSAILEYVVEGKKYSWYSSIFQDKSALPKVGETEYIRIDPKNPQDAYQEISKSFIRLLTIGGMLFVAVGLGLMKFLIG